MSVGIPLLGSPRHRDGRTVLAMWLIVEIPALSGAVGPDRSRTPNAVALPVVIPLLASLFCGPRWTAVISMEPAVQPPFFGPVRMADRRTTNAVNLTVEIPDPRPVLANQSWSHGAVSSASFVVPFAVPHSLMSVGTPISVAPASLSGSARASGRCSRSNRPPAGVPLDLRFRCLDVTAVRPRDPSGGHR